jgi:hypothetical protein
MNGGGKEWKDFLQTQRRVVPPCAKRIEKWRSISCSEPAPSAAPCTVKLGEVTVGKQRLALDLVSRPPQSWHKLRIRYLLLASLGVQRGKIKMRMFGI